MAEDTSRQRRGPSDATDYSSTVAPDTKQHAEERARDTGDPRLHPGGAHGSPTDPGMSSLDRDTAPHGGQSTGQQDIGATRGMKD
jgi:hypothetical protein